MRMDDFMSGDLCNHLLQDGRIDYNEFVAMMQKGNPGAAPGKKGHEFGLREALKM